MPGSLAADGGTGRSQAALAEAGAVGWGAARCGAGCCAGAAPGRGARRDGSGWRARREGTGGSGLRTEIPAQGRCEKVRSLRLRMVPMIAAKGKGRERDALGIRLISSLLAGVQRSYYKHSGGGCMRNRLETDLFVNSSQTWAYLGQTRAYL